MTCGLTNALERDRFHEVYVEQLDKILARLRERICKLSGKKTEMVKKLRTLRIHEQQHTEVASFTSHRDLQPSTIWSGGADESQIY
ncbi:uncharacterized protein PHALS_10688 [Plasmopara halstedii]|uniref:Uncharacterized protein n=1 Tax=Plasmopara halstedii TaxID=4781 RepID=A0A0P1AH35_PLAHL|nr:uncharacterized protein PHALS_10688 [Plasmopara halstedii]CEG40493.1 hypothetical protein PHALS_10688 [Plasmopara halstedii]|eukprot:XP_024576862.1 hypothetical protein PHALS_10688 [Plasmopara halstedii]